MGAVFFLPLNLFLNNLLFTVFFVAFSLKLLLEQPKALFHTIGKYWIVFLVLSGPLLLALMGSFYTSNFYGAFKDLGKLVPIVLVIPLVLHHPNFFAKLVKRLLYAMALGALAAALVCWSLTIFQIFQDGGQLTDLFTQRYANHFLSGKIDVHTPYLGLFIAVSVFFLIRETEFVTTRKKRWINSIWAGILFLFLLNLLARTALFTLLIGMVIYVLYRRKYVILFLGVMAVSALGALAYFQDNNFLRDRIFNSINVFEQETIFSKKDDRFARYSASVEVFKQFPFFGPGTAGEDSYRKEIFYNNRDSKAYNGNYNAHNQFLEYVSTYGIVGAVVFFALLVILFRYAKVDSLSLFLFFAFVMAGLTESILERSWGVSYYLFVIMAIYGLKKEPNEGL